MNKRSEVVFTKKELNKIEDDLKTKKTKLNKAGLGTGLDELDLDHDLLSGLDDAPSSQTGAEEKPRGQFVFGRSNTPNLRSSRSLSKLASKTDEIDSSMVVGESTKRVLPKTAQSSVFGGVLKEASKQITKDSNVTDYLSKNKERLSAMNKRNASKSVDRAPAKDKNQESGQKKQTTKPAKTEEHNKENVPQKKPATDTGLNRKESLPRAVPKKDADKGVKEKDSVVVNKAAGKNDGQFQALANKKEKEIESYSSRADQKGKKSGVSPTVSKSPNLTKNIEKEEPKSSRNPEKSPAKPKRNTSKNGSKREYKPETMDLYMRLNEYTKFKEEVEKLSAPDPQPAPTKPQASNQEISKPPAKAKEAKSTAESFLKNKISGFTRARDKPSPGRSASKKRDTSASQINYQSNKSIDLVKASQPRFKKAPVQLADECSFQPMLSKKSLQIAQKIVSRT